MLWRTHFFAGAITGLFLVGQQTDVKTALVAGSIAGTASLLPDLDDPNSKVGSIVPIISWAIKKTIGHRGPLHSLLGAGVFSILIYIASKLWTSYIIPADILQLIIVGYISHLAMDSFNPQGVPWLWPITKKHFSIPLVRTGSILENWVVNPAMLILCAALYWPIIR